MDLKNLVAVLKANDDELLANILQVADNDSHQRARMIFLRMYSHTYSRRMRRVWTFERHGCFWERDVPLNEHDFFKENFRVDRSSFAVLLQNLQRLRRRDTNFRRCIPLDKRIAIALYALGSSAEYRTVGRLFGVSKSMVGKILIEFCQEAWETMRHEFLPPQFLTQQYEESFEEIGFPQCFGGIDGCHIEIKPASEDAVDYWNYKGWYSTILFALVDYRFIYINVGCPGRCHDSQIYEKSELKRYLEATDLFKENSKRIGGQMVPFVILGDSTFRLSHTVMKPYPFSTAASINEKTFNYSLSKARRVVENAFGHLKARFRRIGKGLDNHASNTNAIIKACCVLHNFLNCRNSEMNENWLAETEQSSRPQPEFSQSDVDSTGTAQQIRTAIST